jgi:hypothetical protein
MAENDIAGFIDVVVERFLVVTEIESARGSQSLLAKDQQQQPQALPNADHAKAA